VDAPDALLMTVTGISNISRSVTVITCLYKDITSLTFTHTSKLELNYKRLYCTILYTRIGRE
jgi:hypothetical protein